MATVAQTQRRLEKAARRYGYWGVQRGTPRNMWQYERAKAELLIAGEAHALAVGKRALKLAAKARYDARRHG